MQIKVKPVSGHRLEIQLAESQLLLPEQSCQEMRDALVAQMEQFALHPKSRWEEARSQFQRLLPALAHLEQFNDNELALLLREYDFTLLYRLAQSKQMDSLLTKLEKSLGRREIDRLTQNAEKLPLKPLWEVNERIQGLIRTIERMTDEGEIRPPRMNIKDNADAAPVTLAASTDAAFIRQLLKKLDSFPEKALFAVFKQVPPRQLAKLWFICEEMSESSLLGKFHKLIPAPMLEKLKPAKPDQIAPADARKTAQLVIEVVKGLQKKKAPESSKGSGPVLV